MFAVVFGVLGAFALVWGRAHLWAGALLRAAPACRARILTLALAVVNLLVLPFGTALGVYALWILLTSDRPATCSSAAPRRRG